MKRVLIGVAAFAVLSAVVLGGAWMHEQSNLRPVDLREFDGEAVGRLDSAMWQSYYEKLPVALFRQMVELLETQYHMPPLMAARNGYRAAHAAFVFQDGSNRIEYEKALPDLERYYADVNAMAMQKFDADRAARLELEWWIVHRESPEKLPEALAELESAIYGIPPAAFADHARLRTEAMVLRDSKGEAINEADWRRIEELLVRSWTSLHEAIRLFPAPR